MPASQLPMTAIYWHLGPCASWVEGGTSCFLSFNYGGTVRTSLQFVYLNAHGQFNHQDTHWFYTVRRGELSLGILWFEPSRGQMEAVRRPAAGCHC